MPNINLGLNGATTKDWLKSTQGMNVTVFQPQFAAQPTEANATVFTKEKFEAALKKVSGRAPLSQSDKETK